MTFGQSYITDIARESARSDKITGGKIEKQSLQAGDPNIRITINLPAFQMTLWQGGREVETYPIGIGMYEFPVKVGILQASSVEWNPVWIPPSSDWIEKSSTVKPGEIVLPTDPRNPLGKVKIPLGYGYLIHQAKGPADMGSLVSHGCVRVMQADLYDLSENIVAARSLAVTPIEIAAAKRNKRTLLAPLDPVVPVEITYDTIVVENGRLNIYPDIYKQKRNTVENVRSELQTSGVDDSKLTDAQIKRMLSAAIGKRKYVVDTSALANGTSLASGRQSSVLDPSRADSKNY
jgi:murein L,D-transpeptidase YcbB/YkuD